MIKEGVGKGQINIFTQPIMLIVLISIFALFVIKTLEVNVHIAEEAEEYYFKSKTIPMFDEIVKCISSDSTQYPYVVSVYKLGILNNNFVDGEAPCVRDEKLGWSATVKDISDEGKSWRLGDAEDSGVYGLKREFGITMPVAIEYEDGSIRAGEVELNVRQGDLEYIVGMVESVYQIGSKMDKDVSASVNMRLDYPVFMEQEDGKKRVCLKTHDGDFCKTLRFSDVEFKEIDAGRQYIVFKYFHRKNELKVIS